MSGALRERASACSRARAVTDYRDVFLVRFDGFAGRFSVARTRRDDRSGSAPIFVSASGFSRLGLSDRPPYPSARDARLTIPPPFYPVRNSTAVKCSAAKPAFVEKVEKAGKAALSGLAALTLAAGVRYFPAIIIPALRATVSTPAGAHRARETPEPAPDDRDRTGARLRARYGRRSRVASAVSGPASTPGLRLFFDDTRPTPGATRGQEIPKTNNARANLPFLTSPLSPSLFYRAVRPGRDL